MPQAAQLGIHFLSYFFHKTQLEMHLLLRDLNKGTPLVKESRKREREEKWKEEEEISPVPGGFQI